MGPDAIPVSVARADDSIITPAIAMQVTSPCQSQVLIPSWVDRNNASKVLLFKDTADCPMARWNHRPSDQKFCALPTELIRLCCKWIPGQESEWKLWMLSVRSMVRTTSMLPGELNMYMIEQFRSLGW